MNSSKKQKNRKRQNTGNRSASEGIAYQCMVATSLILRMLLYDEFKSVKQNNLSHVDDISTTDSQDNRNYYQCKISGDLDNGGFSKGFIKQILTDFYRQYLFDNATEKNDSRYILFSRSEPKNLRKILEALRINPEPDKTQEEHLKAVLSQKNYALFDEIFEELKKKIEELGEDPELGSPPARSTDATPEERRTIKVSLAKDEYARFLNMVDCYSRDPRAVKDEFYQQLESQGYPKYVYHIINTTVLYDWLSTDVSKDRVIDLLREFKVDIVDTKDTAAAPRSSVLLPVEDEFILSRTDERFSNKLKYLLDFINMEVHVDQEVDCVLDAINKNDNLLWHFLRNLKDHDWFPKIESRMIKSVVSDRIDSAVKYQLLNYFDVCTERYSDQIIPLLVELERNTKNPHILAALIESLANLNPSKKENLSPIWRLLETLVEHQHPWVRKRIPGTLKALAEYDLDRSLQLLEELFLYKPVPRDITQGSPILALTFRGSDSEHMVFERCARVLSEMMSEYKFSVKAFEFAINLENHFIKGSREKSEEISDIILDNSYIWLADKDAFGKTEYIYDGRRRIALEIEKRLNEIAESNANLARQLFSLLLQTKQEVFYIAVIEVLIKHPDKYLDFVEEIVFNKDLWAIYNIRHYFLQLLIQKYFESRQDRLPEYVKAVKFLEYKDDEKNTEYTKQALLVSIPEDLRTQDVKQDLSQLDERLGGSAKIMKSPDFTMHWESPTPDIQMSDLDGKTTDELLKLMEDYTVGLSKIDVYDVTPVFGNLVEENPDKFPCILDRMAGKEIDREFSAVMMRGYIRSQKTDLQDILNVSDKVYESDTWARIEVARFLRDECRKKETSNFDESLLEKIKKVLFDLASDKDPENDRTGQSSSPRPDDAITRGINSVRGIATEALAMLAYHFPGDEEITEKLRAFSKDNTKAVKATLIYNLQYLVAKNYTLCKEITSQFRDGRDPEIDFALIRYFARLSPEKFKDNKDFVELLLNSPNDEIQNDLGQLIGSRYMIGFGLEGLVRIIIKRQKGNVKTRQALAFAFESMLEDQIAAGEHQRVIGFFKELLDSRMEPDREVRERAANVFERDGFNTSHFEILDSEEVFNVILEDKSNMVVQSHLIDYLHRCILNDESVSRCINILHSQVTNIDGIFGDPLVVKKIAEVLRRMFSTEDLDPDTKDLVEQIFDKGLEKGYGDFYEIFYEIFHEKH